MVDSTHDLVPRLANQHLQHTTPYTLVSYTASPPFAATRTRVTHLEHGGHGGSEGSKVGALHGVHRVWQFHQVATKHPGAEDGKLVHDALHAHDATRASHTRVSHDAGVPATSVGARTYAPNHEQWQQEGEEPQQAKHNVASAVHDREEAEDRQHC